MSHNMFKQSYFLVLQLLIQWLPLPMMLLKNPLQLIGGTTTLAPLDADREDLVSLEDTIYCASSSSSLVQSLNLALPSMRTWVLTLPRPLLTPLLILPWRILPMMLLWMTSMLALQKPSCGTPKSPSPALHIRRLG